jgi:flagellar motility protein MotE (MotC chaperone)
MKTGYDTHFKKLKKTKAEFKIKHPRHFKTPDEQVPVQKKRKEFPVTALIGAIFVLGGCLYGYTNADKIEEAFGKVDVGFFGLASAEEKKVPPADAKKETSAQAESPAKDKLQTQATGLTPEEIALFKSLEERKKQLDVKEEELKKLEEELHKQKGELDTRMTKLEEIRTQIANQLQERVHADGESVDKLVAFFSAMKPQKAAEIMDALNEDLAVEVLKKMKKKDAAEIMNMLKSEKAQRLSEKFTGYRKN